MDKLALVTPEMRWESAYRAMVDDFAAAAECDYAAHLLPPGEAWEELIARLRDHARGRRLGIDQVAYDTYWLVRDGELLGVSKLRHDLTDALRMEGGHIGYAVRPAARGRGYGTRLLALTLARAAHRGLRRVLLTCDRDNVRSARVILANGGVFEGESPSPHTGRFVSRYWIDLAPWFGEPICSSLD